MPGDMPDWYQRAFTSSAEMEPGKGSVDDVGIVMTFTTSVHSWILFNDGPNAMYFALDNTVSTDSFKIPAKSWLMLDVPTNEIYLICAAGETATAYTIGLR